MRAKKKFKQTEKKLYRTTFFYVIEINLRSFIMLRRLQNYLAIRVYW